MEPLQHAVAGVLGEILRKAPLSPEKVTFTWRTAVGAAIARVSTVALSSDGVLEVRCSDDAWRREIRRSASLIKTRLVALLGPDVVRQVKVPGPATKRKR